jgi:hypothetical protein
MLIADIVEIVVVVVIAIASLQRLEDYMKAEEENENQLGKVGTDADIPTTLELHSRMKFALER